MPGSDPSRRVREWVAAGEPLGVSAVAWAEFPCGPVTPAQVALAAAVVAPVEPFAADDAARAAEWFNATGRRRGSLADCMIAAAADRRGAALATDNSNDFMPFVPLGLRLVP